MYTLAMVHFSHKPHSLAHDPCAHPQHRRGPCSAHGLLRGRRSGRRWSGIRDSKPHIPRVPPAESLFPRGERASIPVSKAHLRSSPFPPPAPSSPPLRRLDSGVSCCSIALVSSFSLLVRRIRDAAVYWIQTMERKLLRLRPPLKSPRTSSALIVGGTQLL
ncbi:hypothetical protein B0H19DRAFT_1262056 [Mycena capillaripes]|nr:hypothetical protein B0H19DRAFT_1262056 [Mycena capillaripes]